MMVMMLPWPGRGSSSFIPCGYPSVSVTMINDCYHHGDVKTDDDSVAVSE